MHSTHSPAPKRQVPPENKKFKEIVVTKTQGTVYDPLWYFLFIFVAFFIVWLRTEIVKIRDAYWKVPGVSEVEMKSFNDLWWALAACIGIAVFPITLKFIGRAAYFPMVDHRLVHKSPNQFQHPRGHSRFDC